MGLFKTVVNAANPSLALSAFSLSGGKTTTGDLAEKFVSGDKVPQINPDLRQLEEDIQKVRDLRDADIEGPRQSTELALEQLERDRVRSTGDVQAGTMGRFEALQNALARQGGIDSGSSERLAMQSQREATLGAQRVGGDFQRLQSDVLSGDLAAQEQLQDRALFATPQLSSIPTDVRIKAQAANMQARALADQAKKQRLGALGSLAGAGVGAFFGGPVGASVGGSVGGGLFSSLG